MPELPDVENIRTYLQHTVLHKSIAGVSVPEKQVLQGISPQQLGKRIRNTSFSQALRHGKYCFLTSRNRTLVFHFGMTGDVRCFKLTKSRPDYICLAISFENNYTLAYTSTRKLGTITICTTPGDFIQEHEIGPDALSPDIDRQQFVSIFDGRRGMLKPALMNQQFLAGIGNVYSDEILFQEGFHPKTAVRQLDGKHLGNLFTTMKNVLRKGIAAQGKPEELPDSYLTAHRTTDRECPKCRKQLDTITVSGRSACFCPSCQKNAPG